MESLLQNIPGVIVYIDEISTLSRGFVPVNTRKNTQWSMNVFEEWQSERNKADKDQNDLLTSPDIFELNF